MSRFPPLPPPREAGRVDLFGDLPFFRTDEGDGEGDDLDDPLKRELLPPNPSLFCRRRMLLLLLLLLAPLR